jgi:hypothetical protein
MHRNAAPTPGDWFSAGGRRKRLDLLVGNFQHPLFKAQAARLRLRLECSFFVRRQVECDSHNCGSISSA